MIREVLTSGRTGSMAPDEAAAMWIARRSGGVVLDEEPGFREWFEADGSNRQAWQDANAAMRCFDGSDDDELLQEMRRAALAAGPDLARQWTPLAAIAASLALVMSASLLLLDRSDAPPASVIAQAPDPLSQVGSLDFVTAKGERKEITLSDGSRLTLDTDSAVDVAFSPEERNLILAKGRALFDVQGDLDRPFKVRAGGNQVVALGTRFDVRVDPGQVRVTLFEGSVAVSSANRVAPVRLKAGEQFLQRGASAQISAAAPVENALAWRQGMVVFENETLGAAAAELNRYSARPLVIPDLEIAGMRISGAFKAGDPDRFARTVSSIHPVRVVRRSDGSIEISPRG